MLVPTHGLGGASDLPVPLPAAVAAGGATLVLSFLILTLAWKTPRNPTADSGIRLPAAIESVLDSEWTRWLIRIIGLVGFGYANWALVFGPDLVTNPALGVFYVVVWVGLVPASLLAGPIVRMLNPLRSVHLILTRAFGVSTDKGLLRFPEKLGYWPAALGLFAFVWQELVNPNSSYLYTIQIWLAGYAGIMLLGAALFGDIWFARMDPFEVFATLVSKLSIWGRDLDGRAVIRSPLSNLDRVEIAPGLLGVTAVLLGSTAFDSFKGTVRWYQFIEPMKRHEVLVSTAGLLVFCGVIAVTFAGAAIATKSTIPRRELPDRYAPSLIPIVVGYFVAHYLTYFYQMSQQTLIQLSDPMATGANLLGTGNWSLHYGLSNYPTPLAITKVSAIVIGHVLGATAAHGRALTWLPERHRILGQLAMMVIMICYTVLGLFLLFSS